MKNEVLSTLSKTPCPIELRTSDSSPVVVMAPVVALTEKQRIQHLLDELYHIRMASKKGDGLGYLVNAQANIITYLNNYAK